MMHNSSPMKLRVVIPARYGSSRLPGKPLVDIAGLPMVVRVFQRVETALPNAEIVVATDDQRIGGVLKKYCIPFILTAVEHNCGSDRTAEAARLLDWPADDIIINVQGDEPLLPLDLLRAFSDFCCTHPSLEMASVSAPLSTHEQIHDTNIVKVVLNQNSDAILFSRSAIPFCRDLPQSQWPLECFTRHIGIYAYRNSILQKLTSTPECQLESMEKLEQLRALWLGVKISMMKWHSMSPHGVDTAEDVQRVIEIILKERS